MATRQKRGLYALDEGNYVQALSAIKVGTAPIGVWNHRLGRAYIKYLEVLNKNRSINISIWLSKDLDCSTCQMGKQCKQPFILRNEI